MICVPIRRKTVKSLIDNIKKAQKHTDVIEIWFDELGKNLKEENLKKIFKALKKPVLYKSFGERAALEKVLQFQPDYIDLDLATPQRLLKLTKKLSPQTKLIISHHDFKSTPSDRRLGSIIKKMSRKGADIIKLAAHANSFTDSLRMLSLLDQLTLKGQEAICICMGRHGRITRATGHLLGNHLMYAPLDLKAKTAPGQIALSELKQIHKLLPH